MNARTDRHAHLALLDQVADSEAEARDVRRAFGVVEAMPLAAHELDTLARYQRAERYPIRSAACANGPCAQGRKLCPTPQACQISAEPEAPRPPLQRGDGPRVLAGLLLAVALIVTLVTLVVMEVRS